MLSVVQLPSATMHTMMPSAMLHKRYHAGCMESGTVQEFGKDQAETQKVLVQPALELAVSSSATTLLQLITKITEQVRLF